MRFTIAGLFGLTSPASNSSANSLRRISSRSARFLASRSGPRSLNLRPSSSPSTASCTTPVVFSKAVGPNSGSNSGSDCGVRLIFLPMTSAPPRIFPAALSHRSSAHFGEVTAPNGAPSTVFMAMSEPRAFSPWPISSWAVPYRAPSARALAPPAAALRAKLDLGSSASFLVICAAASPVAVLLASCRALRAARATLLSALTSFIGAAIGTAFHAASRGFIMPSPMLARVSPGLFHISRPTAPRSEKKSRPVSASPCAAVCRSVCSCLRWRSETIAGTSSGFM